jgi:hypothetical protein
LSITSSASLAVDGDGALLRDADRLGNRRGDHRRVCYVDQIHEPHPLAAGRREFGRDAQRQPGLADATRAGGSDHAVLGERRDQHRPLAGATDEGRNR